MKREHLIKIEISGPVQTGKTAVLESIKHLLREAGYMAVIHDRENRNNEPDCLSTAERHEKPDTRNAVFLLTEKTNT